MIIVWLKLMAATVLGLAFQLWAKNVSLQETASKANATDYSLMYFLKKDKVAIIGTLLTMATFFLVSSGVINSIIENSSHELKAYAWGYIRISDAEVAQIIIIVLCMTIAYTGQDAALRFFGRTSKELKDRLQDFQSGSKQ